MFVLPPLHGMSTRACVVQPSLPRIVVYICRQRIWGLDWVAAPPPSSAITVLAAMQVLAGVRTLLCLLG